MDAEDGPSSLPSPKSENGSSYDSKDYQENDRREEQFWKSCADSSRRQLTIQKPPVPTSESESVQPTRQSAPPALNTTAPTALRCTYSECTNRVFTRPCELRKHVQRHTRPFHCTHPDCTTAENPPRGFTYFGGLTRHEREVHDQHGGTREIWYCPIVMCKRHSGEGFKRRDNMKEHVRRMHATEDFGFRFERRGQSVEEEDRDDEDLEDGEVREEGVYAVGSVSALPTPPPITISHRLPDRPLSTKRKYYADAEASEEETEVEAMYHSERMRPEAAPNAGGRAHEVKRLRMLNEEKDAEIARLRQWVSNLRNAMHLLTAPVDGKSG